MNIIYEDFDGMTASDEEMDLLFDYSDIIFREFEKDEPLTPREVRRISLRQKSEERKSFRVLAKDGDLVVGSGMIGISTEKDPGYEKNKKISMMNVSVLQENRRKGIGFELMRRLLGKIENYPSIIQILTDSDNEIGQAFTEHLGGNMVLASAENRLYLDKVDWEMVKEWNDKGAESAKKERITQLMLQDMTDDIIEEYTEVYSETMNQQPLGGIDVSMKTTPETRREQEDRMKKLGITWHTKISQENDGKISGLTEMLMIESMPWKAIQNLTGVREKYRGRGLGKWLKADMLLYARDNYPEVKYITTGNADSNAPMIAINTRLGFATYKQAKNYMFDLKELRKKLGM